MVQIVVDNEVWNMYGKSWALNGIRTDEKLIRMPEDQIWRESISVIEAAEQELVDDTPEVYAQREIGLEKERKKLA